MSLAKLPQLLAEVGRFANKYPDVVPSLFDLIKALFTSEDPQAAVKRATTAAATRRIWRRPR